MEFTNASQVSEMKNFSGGAISEILPIRGGEVVPIVAGNLFSPMFMYAILAFLILAVIWFVVIKPIRDARKKNTAHTLLYH